MASPLDSERGFLEVAGRDPDRPLRDQLLGFRDLVSADMDWADSRKRIFRRNASVVRIAALVLTAASTVVLGIQEIPARASIALPMVALVTVLGGLETFFSWRARWVLMEETRYRFNRLRDELDYYIVATPAAELSRDRLQEFFDRHQVTWADASRQWVEFRRLDRPPQSPEVRA
ncbi:SLATT domain-containing protein [Amycolatopsis sp. NBC_01488]|uniref:SLATT domain-containing protein n=1 Tax=Amycolatopsis sp. NBC_01488 TaxID=2903563 RepID=UPI002E2C43F3|nr:SLATT domain-containing protein [Amycolatopsis sp. NBC_01488]